MFLPTYFNRIKAEIDRYAATRFVLDAKINFDSRPGDQGYLNGTIHFVDGSALHFKEYVDALNQNVDKLTYSYHSQDAGNQIIFRYDNAAHNPHLPFVDHNPLPNQIISAPAPQLEDVLAEIFILNEWTKQ